MRGILFTITIFFAVITLSKSQDQDYVPNEILVQLHSPQSIVPLMQKLYHYDKTILWDEPERLIPNMEIWRLKYQGNHSQEQLVRFIGSLSIVQIAQNNHKIELRSPHPTSTTPNDPNFSNQWQYINNGTNGGTAGVDLDADLAWDITTGGLTVTGDTIVIAILDNGISPTQVDFGNNLWVNRAEIPNNHIDDDNNGYEDDYKGWNTTSNSDLINGGSHGTSVAGIIGAKGNNNTGVTGVNWNVKMMIIKNDFNSNEANVLMAYGYALTQRKKYNQSNGQEGAYVVATNASWGVNGGQASSVPLWCAFYDTLGAYGILNIAATANQNIDVDMAGDLPTTCPSDYLVAVTNVNKVGSKEINAAWGKTHIDLGAFGSGVYTTNSPSGYGTFGGTSAASPHVAGAVGLLYSGACNNFMAYSLVHPDSAALKMKKYLLDGVVPILDLDERSVSEGYLNLNNSLLLCINDCPTHTCFSVYNTNTTNISDTQAQVNWTFPNTSSQIKYRYKTQGGIWSTETTLAQNTTSLILNNLMSCTNYDVELISVCNSNPGDTARLSFKTEGCCEAPNGLSSLVTSSDSVYINWQNLLVGDSYIISYKESGTNTWITTPSIDSTNHWLTGLNSCTYYNLSIQAICNTGDTTNYSDTISFVTLGCMGCDVLSYCSANGNNSADDWIDTFSIDNFVNASGNNNGYLFHDTVEIYLGKGDFHNVAISQGKTFTEFVKVWLDLNQDGDFTDSGEELFSGVTSPTIKTLRGSFIVPPTALLGITRMRVGMNYNQSPLLCGTMAYGEVEDYCVQVIQGNSIHKVNSNISNTYVYPNPFSDLITIQFDLFSQSDISIDIISVTGQTLFHIDYSTLSVGQQKLSITPEIPTGIYFIQISTKDSVISKKIIKQ